MIYYNSAEAGAADRGGANRALGPDPGAGGGREFCTRVPGRLRATEVRAF